MGRFLSNSNQFNDPIYLECNCTAELVQIWPFEDGTTSLERWSAYRSPKPVLVETSWIRKILDNISTEPVALPCLNVHNRYLIIALIEGSPKYWVLGLYKRDWRGRLKCLWEIMSPVVTINQLRDALHIQTPFAELDH